MTQKAPTIIKEKMNLLHFIKMKNICFSKDTKLAVHRQRENISRYMDRGLI